MRLPTRVAYPEPRKIERKCPSCRTRDFHWLRRELRSKANKPLDGFFIYFAGCTKCMHEWTVRVPESLR